MSYDSVPKLPVPSRLTQGSEVPHIGPNFEAYQKAHAETVGPAADKWWAKVSQTAGKPGTTLIYGHSDGQGNPSLGPPFPHCPLWKL